MIIEPSCSISAHYTAGPPHGDSMTSNEFLFLSMTVHESGKTEKKRECMESALKKLSRKNQTVGMIS
jgi:hypothetical protein